MEENAEISACVKLLRLGVMAWHGETLGHRATVHRAVREAVGRSALISATQAPLCSSEAPACLVSCMRTNVWHGYGWIVAWIWMDMAG